MSPPNQNISVSAKAIVLDGDQVLLIKYSGSYIHYNFPGGRVRDGETLREAVVRTVARETCCDVTVERLLFVVEYVPDRWQNEFGTQQKVQFNFLCSRKPDSPPARMPDEPDDRQIDVLWVPTAELANLRLLPRVADRALVALRLDGSVDPLVDEW